MKDYLGRDLIEITQLSPVFMIRDPGHEEFDTVRSLRKFREQILRLRTRSKVSDEVICDPPTPMVVRFPEVKSVMLTETLLGGV